MQKQKTRNDIPVSKKSNLDPKVKYIISKGISNNSRLFINKVVNPGSYDEYKEVKTNIKKSNLDSSMKYIMSKHLIDKSKKESIQRKKVLPNNDNENIFGRMKEPVKFTQKRRFNTATGKTEEVVANSYSSVEEKEKSKARTLNNASRGVNKNHNLHNNNYFSNKMIDKIDRDQNYDSTDDLSVKSSLYMRKGLISSKAAIIKTKKACYVVRNLNPDKRKQIKEAYLSQVNVSDIKRKRKNVYKHYTVKNLLADKLENQVIKNAKVNYNYTSDISLESAKMAIEKTYDTAIAVKSISSKVNTLNKIIRTSKIKRDTASKTKATQNINNKQKNGIKQTMVKNKYILNKKRYEAIKKTSSNASRSTLGRFAFNLSNPQVLKYTAVKLLLPVAILAMIFMFFSFITSGGTVTTSSYKIIGAEKRTIREYKSYVSKLDKELADKVEKMKKSESSSYDDVVVDIYGDDGKINTSFKELLVLNTVYFEQDVKYTSDEISHIKSYHSKMNEISKKIENYKCSGCKTRYCSSENCSGHDYCSGHKRLHIIVNCLSMEDIIEDIGFNDFQKEWARELMLWDLENMYPGEGFEVDGGISGLSGLTSIEIAQIISGLPETGVKRSQIINSAVSLVGKVPYFWGGKSSAGWNSSWNTPRMVTAPGVSDSGTVIPYGLDCSGFIDWAYKTAGVGNVLSAGGTAYQWNQSYGINKRDALPGDLVFKNPPNSNGINHVGIYLGKDSSGRDRFVHCSYSDGVTIDSWSGFKYYRRVKVKLDE